MSIYRMFERPKSQCLSSEWHLNCPDSAQKYQILMKICHLLGTKNISFKMMILLLPLIDIWILT